MIALVLSAHPADQARTRAGIDLAMTLATFETPFELFFTGPACQCLQRSDVPKSPARLLSALPMYGLDQWFHDQEVSQPIDGSHALSTQAMRQRIRQASQVIRV